MGRRGRGQGLFRRAERCESAPLDLPGAHQRRRRRAQLVPAREADLKSEDVLNAAIDDEEDSESSDFDGHVYAFSFPSIVKAGEAFPIKIGKTVGDVTARVQDQCKGSASFENPVILGSWPVQRLGPTELAIHNVLKARGKWREDVPGREWFNTTMDEVSDIIKFVTAV